MCELMAIAAASACTAAAGAWRKKNPPRAGLFGTAALMWWGAALMWGVDGVFRVLEGEGFFDLSRGDAVLGAIVLAAGAAITGVLAAVRRRRASAARAA